MSALTLVVSFDASSEPLHLDGPRIKEGVFVNIVNVVSVIAKAETRAAKRLLIEAKSSTLKQKKMASIPCGHDFIDFVNKKN